MYLTMSVLKLKAEQIKQNDPGNYISMNNLKFHYDSIGGYRVYVFNVGGKMHKPQQYLN